MLKNSINTFWEWSGLTPEEYKSTRFSQKIYLSHNNKLSGEWEEEYPEFDKLESVFFDEIRIESNFLNDEFVRNVVYAIAIDNESERLVEHASNILNEINYIKIVNMSLILGFNDAQWQLVTRVPKSRITDKEYILLKFVNNGGNDYVKKRATYVLEHIKDFY
jgi:hypothetical protein